LQNDENNNEENNDMFERDEAGLTRGDLDVILENTTE
jgi:hypothetical protein